MHRVNYEYNTKNATHTVEARMKSAAVAPQKVEEKHGQSYSDRFDPFFTSPVCYTLGIACTAVGIGFVVYFATRKRASDSSSGTDRSPIFDSTSVGAVVGFSILIFIGILCLSFGSYRFRFYLRTGRWAQHPKTKDEILEAFRHEENKETPVSGEGWNFYISRKNAKSSPVALRGNWSGLVKRVSKRVVRVKTGTLFGELTRIMDKYGLVLYDRPQFDQMTVGGATRTCAHGWCTYAWFIDSVIACEALEKGTGLVVERRRGEDDDFLSVLLGEQYVLLEVEIEGQRDRNLQVVTKRYPSPEDAGEVDTGSCDLTSALCFCCRGKDDGEMLDLKSWSSAPYRLIFIYQQSIVTKTGVFTNDPIEATVGNVGLRIRYYQRQLGFSGDWSIVDSIADSHTIVQSLWPSEIIYAHMMREDLNVEIYTSDNLDIASSLAPLTRFHRKNGGRTEFRVRKVAGQVAYAVDVTIDVKRRGNKDRICNKTPQVYLNYFELLRSFGVKSGAIHRGKYIPPSLGPIEEISMTEFWSTVNLGSVLRDDEIEFEFFDDSA